MKFTVNIWFSYVKFVLSRPFMVFIYLCYFLGSFLFEYSLSLSILFNFMQLSSITLLPHWKNIHFYITGCYTVYLNHTRMTKTNDWLLN